MPTAGSLSLTLHDYLKRLNPNQSVAAVIEVLAETNEILEDMMYMQANGITTHRTTIRTGLPTAAWRRLNYGVPRSKSITTQVDDRIGMLETWSVVDKDLAELNGNSPEFMLSESRAFLEAMAQKVAYTLFYGDLIQNPDSFMGLAPRYNERNPDIAQNAEQVIDYGGTTENANTSIWLVGFGDLGVHVTYPKGSTLGVQQNKIAGGGPNGSTTIADDDGNEFLGYKTHYKWNIGMVLRDWRYATRICNIDIATLDDMIQNGAAQPQQNKLYRLMIQAVNQTPNLRLVRPFWYCNSEVGTMLDVIAAEKPNAYLNIGEFEGRKVTMFRGIPVRRCDAIENGEALVPYTTA